MTPQKVAKGLLMTNLTNKDETFASLCTEFKIHDSVQKLLKDSPMENLDDFRFFWGTEGEIAAFVNKATDLEQPMLQLQAARLRMAWSAVRRARGHQEGTTGLQALSADLDDLLEEATLREVRVVFWRRYRMRFPAEATPSDRLLSRCYRELDRRLLTV